MLENKCVGPGQNEDHSRGMQTSSMKKSQAFLNLSKFRCEQADRKWAAQADKKEERDMETY